MANLGEHEVEETEYESESEESCSALATRRKLASDGSDDNGNSEGEARESFVRNNWRFRVGHGDESDGLGGYDEDDAVLYENESEELGNEPLQVFKEEDDFEETESEDRRCQKEAQEGVKKRKEKECDVPVVPKVGSFYMHDDRFIGRGHGPRRWTFNEKFKAIKDEPKWKHDKFEETKAWETYDKKFNAFVEVGRISEEYLQGHHKNQGKGENCCRTHDNLNNQNYSSRVVRGRGHIQYKPIMRSSNVKPSTKNKQLHKPHGKTSNASSRSLFSTKNEQSWKFMEKTSNYDSVRVSSQMSNVESDSLASEKQVFTANTSFASQMFNSSSPSKHDSVAQKREVQPEIFGFFPTCALPNHIVYVPQCNSLLQGKIRANPIGHDKLQAESLVWPASENFLTNLPLRSSITWPTYTIASPQIMGQRDLPFSTMLTHPLSPTHNQNSLVYPLVQQPIVQQMLVESMIQHNQLGHCSGSVAQASSEALLPNSYVLATAGSLPRLNKSIVLLGGKGNGTLQGSGIDSLLSSETESDQNFTATAAFFPDIQGLT